MGKTKLQELGFAKMRTAEYLPSRFEDLGYKMDDIKRTGINIDDTDMEQLESFAHIAKDIVTQIKILSKQYKQFEKEDERVYKLEQQEKEKTEKLERQEQYVKLREILGNDLEILDE